MRKWILASLIVLALAVIVTSSVADKVVTITFTGDCTLGSEERLRGTETSFDSVAAREGYDYFFEDFKELFASDDYTLINFEGVLSDSSAQENKTKTYRFRGPTSFVNILKSVSIEGVTLANNHVADYGNQGLESTKKTLDEAGIEWGRLQKVLYVEKDGVRIALICMDRTTLGADYRGSKKNYNWLNEEIPRLKLSGEADAVVVVFHGGTEYRANRDETEQRYANMWIGLGADLVIMHHPHVVEGIDIIQNRAACYSLGNFCFGGNAEVREEVRRIGRSVTALYSLVVQADLHFDDDGHYSGQQLRLYPVFISRSAPLNDYHPMLVKGSEAAQVMEAVQYDTPMDLPLFDEAAGCVTLPFYEAAGSTPAIRPGTTQNQTQTNRQNNTESGPQVTKAPSTRVTPKVTGQTIVLTPKPRPNTEATQTPPPEDEDGIGMLAPLE